MRYSRHSFAKTRKSDQGTAIYPYCGVCASNGVEKVIELLTNLTDVVRNKEPGVFSYRLYKEFDQTTGNEDLILVEKSVLLKTLEHACADKEHQISRQGCLRLSC